LKRRIERTKLKIGVLREREGGWPVNCGTRRGMILCRCCSHRPPGVSGGGGSMSKECEWVGKERKNDSPK
jgi:hypothetical protein